MKLLKRLSVAVLLLVLLIVIMAFSFQSKFIFFPGKLSEGYQYRRDSHQEIFLRTSDGERINALFYPGERQEVVLYFHGNAGDLSSWQFIADDFIKLGYNFLIIDYRGYGKSSGNISELGFYADAEAAYSYLVNERKFNKENIIIYGRSIGSGVAVDLAARYPSKALILEAPYSSLKDLAREKAPWLFPHLWISFHFDSRTKIERVQCPVLLIHGSEDSLIPPVHSRKLFEACKSQKRLMIVEGASHNDVNSFSTYHTGLKRFCDALK